MNAMEQAIKDTKTTVGRRVRKIIVAVHGIGDQVRNETIQTAATKIGECCDETVLVPLGSFHQTSAGQSGAFVFEEPAPPASPLAEIGFAEVYWADIPREVVKDGYTLEEAKKWGSSVVGRVREAARRCGRKDVNYDMLRQVLSEIVETIRVVERLALLGKKAGVLDFNLGRLLQDYLCDVQIVAEFKAFREKILSHFNEIVGLICKHYPQAEIHIVAHSEGTVVSWLALLQALANPAQTPWIRNVRGFMTLGSPIDKHLILWPSLFANLKPGAANDLPTIKWRNYYDFGDPIGFELDTARSWMKQTGFDKYFEFDGDEHDLGFARYYLPGKAHNDYWGDLHVFGHFINDVIGLRSPASCEPLVKKGYTQKPKNKLTAQLFSYVCGYLVPFVLLCVGLYVFYKPTADYLHPAGENAAQIFNNMLGLGALLAGITVLARIPRLVRSWFWQAMGFVVFGVGCAGFVFLTQEETQRWLGEWPQRIGLDFGQGRPFAVLVFAFLVSVVMFFLSKWFPRAGMKPIIGVGAAAIVFLAGTEIYAVDDEKRQIWPLLLGGAAFLYLWWLAALLFDLVFVWHRYVRFGGALDRLREAEAKKSPPSKIAEAKEPVPLRPAA